MRQKHCGRACSTSNKALIFFSVQINLIFLQHILLYYRTFTIICTRDVPRNSSGDELCNLLCKQGAAWKAQTGPGSWSLQCQGKDVASSAASISSLSLPSSQLELHPLGLALSPSLGTGSTLFQCHDGTFPPLPTAEDIPQMWGQTITEQKGGIHLTEALLKPKSVPCW